MPFFFSSPITLIIASIITYTLSSCTTGISSAIETDSITFQHAQFQEASKYAKAKQYDKAIVAFNTCIINNLPSDCNQPEVENIVTSAMAYLVDMYQYMDTPQDAVHYMSDLITNHTSYIQENCLRDMYSIYAYALARNNQLELAMATIDTAFTLKLKNSTPQRLFRDYAYAAYIYRNNPTTNGKVMEWCYNALHQAKLTDNPMPTQFITHLLGKVYRHTGKLSKALDLFHESIEMAEEQGDIAGQARGYNALSELYLYWDIPFYADDYANMALQCNTLINNSNTEVTIHTYLLKSDIKTSQNQSDSAIYYLQKAENYRNTLPYQYGESEIDQRWGTYLVTHCDADSLQLGIEKLQHVAQYGNALNQASAYYQLSIAYLKQQEDEKAEIMLDSMVSALQHFDMKHYIYIDYGTLLRHYINKKDAYNIERHTLSLIEECEFNFDTEICTRMYETILQARMERQEKELQLHQIKVEYRQLYLLSYVFFTLCVAVISFIMYRQKQKIHIMKQEQLKQNLSSLMMKLEITSRKKMQAELQLSQILLEQVQTEENEIIPPTGFMHEESEAEFRDQFNSLYPNFQAALKKEIPNVTRKEELLCMLITLGQGPQEIANIMGIAHRSVIMARYRLKQKLDKDKVLEDTLKVLIL
ncbi:MAG: hypothetical protein ACRDDZ_04530 [Marinifilaceae bacterium]